MPATAGKVEIMKKGLLKDEMEVRMFLFDIIEGHTGVYHGWTHFGTVELIKICFALGVSRRLLKE